MKGCNGRRLFVVFFWSWQKGGGRGMRQEGRKWVCNDNDDDDCDATDGGHVFDGGDEDAVETTTR